MREDIRIIAYIDIVRAIFEEKSKIMTTNLINDEYLLPDGRFYKMEEYLGK
jgi:hypothetical protein